MNLKGHLDLDNFFSKNIAMILIAAYFASKIFRMVSTILVNNTMKLILQECI